MPKPKPKQKVKSPWLDKVQAHTLDAKKQQCQQLHQQGVGYRVIARQLSLTTATVKKWINALDTDSPRG